jgi:hypothetical protein
LPAPLASLLAKYQAEVEPPRSMKAAFELLEGALTLCTYAAFADYCAHRKRAQSRLWKGYTKRSAGPLWGLLKGILEQMSDEAWLSKPLRSLLVPENAKAIDAAISQLNDFKHDRLPAPIDLRPTVELIADACYRAFRDVRFGFFERVQLARFRKEFQGLFRKAVGVAPFFEILRYRGSESFADYDPFLLQESSGVVLPLTPFCFWDTCEAHPDLPSGHLFVYDSSADSDMSFKALGAACIRTISKDGQYGVVWEQLDPFRSEDQRISVIQAGQFDSR